MILSETVTIFMLRPYIGTLMMKETKELQLSVLVKLKQILKSSIMISSN